MILTNIQPLFNDMNLRGENRAIFPFYYNGKRFSCIFLIDTNPYLLYLYSVGNDCFYIEFEIKENFFLNPFLDRHMRDILLDYLELIKAERKTFSPKALMGDFDNKIPTRFKSSPTRNEVFGVARRLGGIDGLDKNYFFGWRRNPQGSNVSQGNFKKTMLCFGYEIAKQSRQGNFSSRWSDNPNDEQPLTPPV